MANAAQHAWYERPQSPTAPHVLALSTAPHAFGPSMAVALVSAEAATAAAKRSTIVVKRAARQGHYDGQW